MKSQFLILVLIAFICAANFAESKTLSKIKVEGKNIVNEKGEVIRLKGVSFSDPDKLEKTINNADVDLVIIGTPIDLSRIIKINKPAQRVRYELQEIGQPTLEDVLKEKFGK